MAYRAGGWGWVFRDWLRQHILIRHSAICFQLCCVVLQGSFPLNFTVRCHWQCTPPEHGDSGRGGDESP
eukprot:7306852-Alexandrium_andersonii.AAC.1